MSTLCASTAGATPAALAITSAPTTAPSSRTIVASGDAVADVATPSKL